MIELMTFSTMVLNANAAGILQQLLNRTIGQVDFADNKIKQIVQTIDTLRDEKAEVWYPSDTSLGMVYQSFIITTSKSLVIEICQETNLKMVCASDDLKDYFIGVLSGSLLDWKNCVLSIIGEQREDVSRILKFFASKVLSKFEEMNLGYIFGNYVKQIVNNITYIKSD